jgi:multiple sugar transport system substrate-binding protein
MDEGRRGKRPLHVKLNDFPCQWHHDGFAACDGYGYWWPKNANYALPAYASVVGWTYRKDWLNAPSSG